MTSTLRFKFFVQNRSVSTENIFPIKNKSLHCEVLSKLLISLYELTKDMTIGQYETIADDALLS